MKIGVFSYTCQNLGDEIQSIAARDLLPRVDEYVERDRMSLAGAEKIFLIANGWYMANPANFPPPPSIVPFYVSIHITDDRMLTRAGVEHLKRHAPIGCRDFHTLSLLRRHDIPAYFSGCLTVTLRRREECAREGTLLVDVPERAMKEIPEHLLSGATVATPTTARDDKHRHDGWRFKNEERALRYFSRGPRAFRTSFERLFYNQWIRARQRASFAKLDRATRFEKAEAILRQCNRASLVITGRLHAALPAIAMGVPVIFVTDRPDDPRFGALKQHAPIYDARDLARVDWNPEPVRTEHLLRQQTFLREVVMKAATTFSNPVTTQDIPDIENYLAIREGTPIKSVA